jgi:hypothetical protein
VVYDEDPDRQEMLELEKMLGQTTTCWHRVETSRQPC